LGLSKSQHWQAFLDDAGAPVGIQQKLMRHAQMATTMNTYGNAQMNSKRMTNTKVVQTLLPAEERGYLWHYK
jgi:integrase